MRITELVGKTLRDAPAEVNDPARRLLMRAGLIRSVEAETVWLPLGAYALGRLDEGWRARLAELHARAMRWPPNVKATALAASLARSEIQSYRQLPARVFDLHPSSPRMEALAFEADEASLDGLLSQLQAHVDELAQLAHLPAAWTTEEAGTRWAYVPAEFGESTVMHCPACGYTAREEDARISKSAQAAGAATRLPLEPVATPHADTIQALAEFLGIPTAATAKAVFYRSGEQVIFAIIRGDLNINEHKLKQVLGVEQLEPARDADIRRVGAVPGYASPVGVRGARVIVDETVVATPNLVAGANREGYHLKNTNVPRDYQPERVTDLAQARPGDACPQCGSPLAARRVTWLASTARVDLGATYLDAQGRPARLGVGLFTFDPAAFLASVVAQNHDEKGILWSPALAPFDVYVVALNADKPPVAEAVSRVCGWLDAHGMSYLLDDRAESAGVKFNDADLIGLPIRITLGPRTVAQNAVEVRARAAAQAETVPLDQLESLLLRKGENSAPS